MTSDQPEPLSTANDELEHELDNVITLHQQLQKPDTLTSHQLSHSNLTFQPSNQSPNEIETRTTEFSNVNIPMRNPNY